MRPSKQKLLSTLLENRALFDRYLKSCRRKSISVDLSGIELKGMTLLCLDLSGVDLTKANFSKSTLTRSNFIGANLTKSNFTNTKIKSVNFTNANCTEVDFRESDASESIFINANLYRANFTIANCTEVDLTNAVFDKVLLHKTNLYNVHGVFQISGFGSEARVTTYIHNSKTVYCGCVGAYRGVSFDEFKRIVNEQYDDVPYLGSYSTVIRTIEEFIGFVDSKQ